jgi:DNA polymerase III gamma/tau subunit
MELELYKKYRPKTFKEVIGQKQITKMLQEMVSKRQIPHTILYSGPSGCGKTTLARILSSHLECGKHDLVEVNCADFRGIDMVREVRTAMMKAPISGKTRVWIIDEAHKLTSDSQNAFLKILEDTPKHVYFMLATTDPHKLLKTIRTRSTEIVVKNLTNKEIGTLLENICEKEGIEITEEVVEAITENSEGSARKALVYLNQIKHFTDVDDMIEVISKPVSETKGIDIARCLFNPKSSWSDMAAILKEAQSEEPETVRYIVLGYARSILLKGGKMSEKAFEIIDVFSDNFYDSKHAGLAACCYEIMTGK